MTRTLHTEPMTRDAFAPFGDLMQIEGEPDVMINQGMCGRYHDKAHIDFDGGRMGVSLFNATPRALPYTLDMMERHPLGCQAFVPMTQHGFLVIVAPDDNGKPGTPRAFLTEPGQAINFHRNTWHGVLTPLHAPGLFAVIDRIATEGDAADNLEEHWFDTTWTVAKPE